MIFKIVSMISKVLHPDGKPSDQDRAEAFKASRDGRPTGMQQSAKGSVATTNRALYGH
jgi:hypothetical protein